VHARAANFFGIPLLKILLWLMAAAPLADLVWLAYLQDLGPNPQESLLRATGLWCLVLLLVTLSITPLRLWLGWAELVRVRRMLGLWVFAYAVIHLLGFWAFEHDFNWAAVFSDGLKRPFVTAGLLSVALLMPLALTSNTWSMRKLAGNWKKLHRLVYLVAAISVLHFYLHKAGKNDFFEPTVSLVVLIGLLLVRARGTFRKRPA
jgi:methionine sulfoxide reductase heme-binding subunit